MLIVMQQVLILFLFIVAGYLLCKTGLVKAEHMPILSTLLVYVFCPCVSFVSFVKNFTAEYLTQKYPLLLIALGILLATWLLAKPLSGLFARQGYARTLYEYSFIVPNYGYMGTALCVGLFGEAALLDLTVFTMPLTVFVGSVGFNMLTRQSGGKLALKRIFTPTMIAVLLGAVVSLSGLQLPMAVATVTQKAADCMAPVSMLLTGIVISQFRLKELLADKRSYVVSLIRMALIPVALFGVVKLLGLEEYLTMVILVYAMPCGMNTIIYPKLIGEDCRIGASLVLVSTLLALVAVPLCMYFLLG